MNPAASSVVTSKAGRSATVTSLMVCCGFIVCWSPNQILFFISFIGLPVDFGSWFYHSPTTSLLYQSCQSHFPVNLVLVRGFETFLVQLVLRPSVKVHFLACEFRLPLLARFSAGSTTSLWCWWSPTAASTLSATPPSTVSSRTASDVLWPVSPDSRIRFSRSEIPALFRRSRRDTSHPRRESAIKSTECYGSTN